MDLLDHLDRLGAAAGLADKLKAGADVDAVDVFEDRRRHGEQLPQAGPEQPLVVGHDHPHGPIDYRMLGERDT